MPKYNQDAMREMQFATAIQSVLGNAKNALNPASVPTNAVSITATVNLNTTEVSYDFLDKDGAVITQG